MKKAAFLAALFAAAVMSFAAIGLGTMDYELIDVTNLDL